MYKLNRNDLNIFIFLIKFGILFLYFFKINNYEKAIDLDNEFPAKYEKNINFSNYSSNIKPIALYNPEFICFNFKYSNLNCHNNSNYNININNNSINSNRLNIIKNQIELAKNHGIYGFAINYYFDFNNSYEKEINIFLETKDINFPFLLIWKNNNFYNLYNTLKIKIKDEEKIPIIIFNKFVNKIKEFITNKLYIKIKNKPILSIENPLIFDNKEILLIRKVFKNKGIGKIFIISASLNHYLKNKTNSLDAAFDSPIYDSMTSSNHIFNISYYSGIIYKNLRLNGLEGKQILFRNSLVEPNLNYEENFLKFYTPEKFYMLNKIIMDWTLKNFQMTEGYFFLDSWNDYGKGNYLEPDEIYGYASLNSFSKALFNLTYIENNYNFLYLNNISIIAIQAHIFYEDLTLEIINKTNNIPFKFDLLITTVSLPKKIYIEQIMKEYSKAHIYKINIVDNQGRDVLPFIIQIKNNIKDFESINFKHHKENIYYINYVLKQLFGNIKIGKKLIFPSGDMFWAKIDAIHQIFEIKFIKKFPKEAGQLNKTLMHAIERLWLYLVKLNGYYYKTIFKIY